MYKTISQILFTQNVYNFSLPPCKINAGNELIKECKLNNYISKLHLLRVTRIPRIVTEKIRKRRHIHTKYIKVYKNELRLVQNVY